VEQVEVTVDELLLGLKQRGIPLPFEIGAFIALEACEQILDRPVRLDARDLGIGEIGEVLCAQKKSEVGEESAVRALLLVLSELLMCSAPGVPALLLELVERGPSAGEWRLERLRADLEAALVPLNRGATRRVLSRYAREAKKSERNKQPSVVPVASEIDAQFDALMALDPPALGPAGAPARAAGLAVRGDFAASTPGTLLSDTAPRPSAVPRGSFAPADGPERPLSAPAGLAGARVAARAAQGRVQSELVAGSFAVAHEPQRASAEPDRAAASGPQSESGLRDGAAPSRAPPPEAASRRRARAADSVRYQVEAPRRPVLPAER